MNKLRALAYAHPDPAPPTPLAIRRGVNMGKIVSSATKRLKLSFMWKSRRSAREEMNDREFAEFMAAKKLEEL